jgi:hypothetical protein
MAFLEGLSMKCVLRVLPMILTVTTLAAPARAFDGWFSDRDDCAPCTRHARAEYGPELARSKHLADLNCAGLAAYAEGWRMGFNQQTLAVYNRPFAAQAPPR